MEKKTIQKIIAGVAVLGSMIGGIFVIDNIQDKTQIQQMRINLIEKSKQGTLTYDEYLQLIMEYDIEIQKVKDKGEKFELKNINKNHSAIEKLNEIIIN